MRGSAWSAVKATNSSFLEVANGLLEVLRQQPDPLIGLHGPPLSPAAASTAQNGFGHEGEASTPQLTQEELTNLYEVRLSASQTRGGAWGGLSLE
jgi:hypothetical protein